MIITRVFYAVLVMIAMSAGIIVTSFIFQLMCHLFISGTSFSLSDPKVRGLAFNTVPAVFMGVVMLKFFENKTWRSVLPVGILLGIWFSGSPLTFYAGTPVTNLFAQTIYTIIYFILTLICYMLSHAEVDRILEDT